MTASYALATWSGLPVLGPDDQLLLAALAERGHRVAPAIWDDPAVPWESFDAVVIRSTWDYYRRRPEFLRWASRVARTCQLWNTEGIVVWNTHKSYLFDLARRGVSVIPTQRGVAGEPLSDLCHRQGWGTVVVKPAISAAADSTHFVDEAHRSDFEPTYAASVARAEQLVQPFLPGVLDPGERSLVYLDGAFSHAFTKGPALPVDRRDSEGMHPVTPTPGELELAARAMAAVPSDVLYARVDMVEGAERAPVLMELELVEPYLHLGGAAGAAVRFAKALERRTGHADRRGRD